MCVSCIRLHASYCCVLEELRGVLVESRLMLETVGWSFDRRKLDCCFVFVCSCVG